MIDRRRIFFIFVVVFLNFLIEIRSDFLHYDRDETNSNEFIHSDCLFYEIDREEFYNEDLSNLINEIIPYCYRPVQVEMSIERIRNETFLTFEQLKQMNFQGEDLFSLTSSIDLIEEYVQYFNEKSQVNGRIYNCSSGRFGRFCEYSFVFTDELSMNEIIFEEFHRDKSDLIELEKLKQWKFPCFVHLNCNYIGEHLCLDWREICDGEIQCETNEIDEIHCDEMEMSECRSDEYRCHNGQCIPREFLLNGFGESECLDRSDEVADLSYPNQCSRDPSFRCEEHLCRKNWSNFPCGDGECLQKFRSCSNGRDIFLRRSMTKIDENLSSSCLNAMICLTKFPEYQNEIFCQNEKFVFEQFLVECEEKFFFPSIPIVSDHIYLLHENVSNKFKENRTFLPDFICFNSTKCFCFSSSFEWKNLSCLPLSQIEFFSDEMTEDFWVDLLLLIHSFFYSCLTSSSSSTFLINPSNNFYRCQNSTKWISKSRIGDENFDCCWKDDEIDDNLRCSIDGPDRIRCSNEEKCFSSLHRHDDCPTYSNEKLVEQIPYSMICDGFEQISLKDSNGFHWSDETNCEYWPCDHLYSRCDQFWKCSNGKDEENCSKTNECEKGFSPCLSIETRQLICLSSDRINDGKIDCLGSIDEQYFCRNVYPLNEDDRRFRCANSDLCLSTFDLCDGISSCPNNDDEIFCQDEKFLCHSNKNPNETKFKEIFCSFNQKRQNDFASFSLQTSEFYPPIDENLIFTENFSLKNENSSIEIFRPSRQKNLVSSFSLKWFCNRGLTLIFHDEIRCFCPPSYYGDRCQFENERISLTIGFLRQSNLNFKEIFLFFLRLIDDSTDEIHSFIQFDSIPNEKCLTKFHRYFLFSSRPKNSSRNFSIRIDFFTKKNLNYRGTWIFSVPWRFYPVNRLVYSLSIDENQLRKSSRCFPSCRFGQCFQFVNSRNRTFCQCFSGWNGPICDQQIDCSNCSQNSFCVAKNSRESICLCRQGQFGRKCSLKSVCQPNRCLNGGESISTGFHQCFCRCSNEFFGSRCENRRNQIEIRLNENSLFDSYLTIYFLSIHSERKIVQRMFIEKLNLFQNEIRFYLKFSFHFVLMKIDERIYFVVIQNQTKEFLRTNFNSERQCFPIETFLNWKNLTKNPFEQIKFSHLICQENSREENEFRCFYDSSFICYCTKENQSNCYSINWTKTFECSKTTEINFCLNGAKCYQNDFRCPTTILCLCPDCFYGSQCQFYAKGLGLTLDEILSSQIRPNRNFFSQKFSIQFIGFLVIILFVYGFINSIFCFFIFQRKISREVGSGIYLFVSSIILIILVFLFVLKYFLLIESFRRRSIQTFLLQLNCFFVEPTQKFFVHSNNWLNTSVAIERAFALFKGISFRKSQSRKLAKYFIIGIFSMNFLIYFREFFFLDIYNDEKEDFHLCVIRYSLFWHRFHSFAIYFQCFLPFIFNLSSALFILISRTKQKFQMEKKRKFRKEFDQHKNLIFTPILLVIFSFPRLILSLTLKCRRSYDEFWLNLFAYFISFIPAFSMFFIFVCSSTIYKKEFHRIRTNFQRNLTSILRSSNK